MNHRPLERPMVPIVSERETMGHDADGRYETLPCPRHEAGSEVPNKANDHFIDVTGSIGLSGVFRWQIPCDKTTRSCWTGVRYESVEFSK
jgi:hypothetical protein